MAKWANDLVMDAALDYIGSCDRMFICSAQPATYAEASSTYMLATKNLSAAFTKANGDSSGRKTTVAQQSAISVTNSGSATHIALGKSGSSELTYVTTCTSQSLTAGNTVTVPAFDIEFADPT